MSFRRAYWVTFILLMLPVLMGASSISPADPVEKIRTYTRGIEFDYLTWTLDAFSLKIGQIALGTADYVATTDQVGIVLSDLDLINQINQVEAQISDIYADPKIADPLTASIDLRKQLGELKKRRANVEPLAEAILQNQVNDIVATYGLTLGGQAIPPVLYHTTPPPDALIISPRNIIRQDHDISISPDISPDQMDALENNVDHALNVSSLVVGIGGIGLYPTMVMETTDINGLVEVVAHEWVHNYLTLHPLGISYMNSPELRIMNETVAAIAGKELGRAVVAKYYPQYLPPEAPPIAQTTGENTVAAPPVFDFRAAMHETRLTTDQLLAAGEIDQAETYMEMRRQFLWDNGYHIRKLNQAYFAFYGAYADQPGGAAGADPVGTAVRLIRSKSSTLADFINRMAWMWDYGQLQRAVGGQ
jgi:hypothetical protein